MTLNADNFIFFYLILAIYGLAVAVLYYAGRPRQGHKHNKRSHS